MTPKAVASGLEKSVQQLRRQVTAQEFLALRDVVNELASQVESLTPDAAQYSPQDLAAAAGEDDLVQAALDEAGRKSRELATPGSIRQGDLAIAEARRTAARTFQDRIDRKEYITSAELQEAWQVKRQAISNAVASGRIFAAVGPSGDNYYPAFYTDPSLDRRVVEKVTKVLGALPAASKYHFFTSTHASLGETPLDALRKGRVVEVLSAAAGFVET
jgi:hypothetical protein